MKTTIYGVTRNFRGMPKTVHEQKINVKDMTQIQLRGNYQFEIDIYDKYLIFSSGNKKDKSYQFEELRHQKKFITVLIKQYMYEPTILFVRLQLLGNQLIVKVVEATYKE